MKDNLKFKKIVRMILALLSTCFLIIMLWILVDCFTTKTTAREKVITYNIKDDMDYYVNLKGNQFYTSKEANENNSYVAALLDTVRINFNYSLTGSRFFYSDYKYNVKTKLYSVKDGKEVWNREEYVLSDVNKSANDAMSIKFDDSIEVDIANLYDIAKEFNDLTGYDVNLKIDVNIVNDLKVENYTGGINNKQVLSLEMPLTKKIISIKKSKTDDVSKSIIEQYEIDERFNSYLFILSSLLTISLFPLAVMSYISLFNLTNLDDYERKLSVIKKKYGHMLVAAKTQPRFKKKEIIEVNNCRDIVNMCIENDTVMHYYEISKGRETWFYAEDEKEVYLYILKLDHREIDMSDKTAVIKIKKPKRKKKSN